jgi:RimJ/RimL family protein N-acetyltransferase
MRVLEKSGFKLEGSLRKSVYKDNRFKDQLMYSILREELLEQ